jgi:hypothetical protein
VLTLKSGISRERMPDVSVNTISDGTFILSPKEDLKPGEYLLTFSSMGISGYDFGIR